MGLVTNNFEDGKGLIRFDDNGISMLGEVDSIKSGIFLKNFFADIFLFIENDASIIFNITKLQFINSVGIKALVEWISLLKIKKPLIKVTFIYNKNISWQEPCVKPLFILSPNSVSIKAE